MDLATLVTTVSEVSATSRRLEKTAKLAALLSQCDTHEVAIAVGFLIGWPRQGKIGVGWALVSEARRPDEVNGRGRGDQPRLSLRDVDTAQ